MAHKARNSRILRPQYCCGVITHLRTLKNFYVSFIPLRTQQKTHAINTQVSRRYLLFVVWRGVGVVIYLAASINLANGLAEGTQTHNRKCYVSDHFVLGIWYFHSDTDEVSKVL